MMILTPEERAFTEGLEELLFVNPVFGAIARAMATTAPLLAP